MFKAKRGDFAVCTKRGCVMVNGGAGYSATTFTVGRVKSVTRDGAIKLVEPFSTSCVMAPRDWNQVDIIPAARIADKAGFEAECRKRQSTSREDWNPWVDVAEICQTARKYV